jgi:hypothetical protein
VVVVDATVLETELLVRAVEIGAVVEVTVVALTVPDVGVVLVPGICVIVVEAGEGDVESVVEPTFVVLDVGRIPEEVVDMAVVAVVSAVVPVLAVVPVESVPVDPEKLN